MDNRNEVTRVNIFGREYIIRGAGAAAHIAEIAHYVDMKMRQMDDNATVATSARVAIFAALNIADELFQLRKSANAEDDLHNNEMAGLADKIEQILDETSVKAKKEISTSAEQNSPSFKNTADERILQD